MYRPLSECEILEIRWDWTRKAAVNLAAQSVSQIDTDLVRKGPDWVQANWYNYHGLSPDRIFALIDRFRLQQLREIESELRCPL